MLQGSVSTTVQSTPEIIWQVLQDKIEDAELSLPTPRGIAVIQRGTDYLTRERLFDEERYIEKVSIDNALKKVTYTLVGHPVYEGYVSHQLLRSDKTDIPGCILAFTIDWKLREGEENEDTPDMLEQTNDDLFHVREMVEQIVIEDIPADDELVLSAGDLDGAIPMLESVEPELTAESEDFRPETVS